VNYFTVPFCGSLNSTIINVDEVEDVQDSARIESCDANKSLTPTGASTPSDDLETSPNHGIGNEQPDDFFNNVLTTSSPPLSHFMTVGDPRNPQDEKVSQENDEKEEGKQYPLYSIQCYFLNPTTHSTIFFSDERKQYLLDLTEVLQFKKVNQYPPRLRGRGNQGQRKNFRRQCRPYVYNGTNGKLYYRPIKRRDKIETQADITSFREVVTEISEQERLIKMFHEGSEVSRESTAMSSHRGRDRLIRALSERYYWQNMYTQAERFCQLCITCKTVNPSSLKVSDPMHPVGVPTRHMAQLGIDISQMPEVDGMKYIIVAIDYFTKWIEAEAIKDKAMGTVARFLYTNILCRHSCPETIITDQGREFCNSLNEELMRLCGGRHRVTSPYHPQANGLVERANRSIKNAMLKVLKSRVDEWPHVLPGVLFAQRTSVHASTKFSPFYLLYGRHPKFPGELHDTGLQDSDANNDQNSDIDGDLKNEWSLREASGNTSEDESTDPFDMDKFHHTLRPMDMFREEVDKAVEGNIKKAQDRQRRGYNKRHTGGQVLKVGDTVFLINQRRRDRKGDKYQLPKSGPYTVVEITDRKTASLRDSRGQTLKTKYPLRDLEPFHLPPPRQDKRQKRLTDGKYTILQ